MDLQTPRPARLPLLDGLRTVAALGVVFYHAPDAFGSFQPFGRMYLLVDLFFLLSGFVLTLAAEPKMRAGMTAPDFVKARINRLWPMVALGALLGAGAFLIDADAMEVLYLLAWSLTMLPLVTSSVAVFPLNAPQWSIFWELVANLVHAAVFYRLSDRALLYVAAAMGTGLVAAIFHTGWGGFGPNGQMWWLAILRVGWAYTLGIWMARKWLAGRPAPLIGWLGALLLPVLILAVIPELPLTLAQGDALFLIVLLPALFWLAAIAVPPRSAESALGWLGSLSFPIYAVHMPLLNGVRFITGSEDHDLLSVMAAIVLSALIARYGSRFRSLARKLSAHHRRAAPA